MKTNENGITLLSLVITVVILAFFVTILVNLSLTNNSAVNVVRDAEDSYYDQKEYTQNRINEMTNGWENLLD